MTNKIELTKKDKRKKLKIIVMSFWCNDKKYSYSDFLSVLRAYELEYISEINRLKSKLEQT